MNDMSQVIIPKSDQLNAEDFLAGPRTYTIEGVQIQAGTEQPVNIKLAGEKRAWRPCKSMSRVLVSAWGPDANAYIGRSVTLYNDPKVKWGGMEVGGIRVSHMSHIERDMLLQLTATKGKRAPHVVKVLADAPQSGMAGNDQAGKWANGYIAKLGTFGSLEALNAFADAKAETLAGLERDLPNAHAECLTKLKEAREKFMASDGTLSADNPAATEGKPEADMGEGYGDGFAGFEGE